MMDGCVGCLPVFLTLLVVCYEAALHVGRKNLSDMLSSALLLLAKTLVYVMFSLMLVIGVDNLVRSKGR